MRIIFSKTGATTVEFAIIALLLFTLIFGAIDIGILVYNRQVIVNAAREGARRGIVMRNPRITVDEVRNTVLSYCQNNLLTGGSNPSSALKQPNVYYEDKDGVSVTGPEDAGRYGVIVVEAEYSYDFFVISYLGIGPRLLKAEVKMTMEGS